MKILIEKFRTIHRAIPIIFSAWMKLPVPGKERGLDHKL
jgi:hypothetical protein